MILVALRDLMGRLFVVSPEDLVLRLLEETLALEQLDEPRRAARISEAVGGPAQS